LSATIPILQVRDSSVVVYHEPLYSRRFSNNLMNRHRMRRAQKKQYSGTMTDGAKKRMAKAITLMCQASKPRWIKNEVTGKWQYHRLSFITLTVSNHKNIKHKWAVPLLLKPFLRWLREVKKVSMVIWKQEFQERGQLHYHITCPEFIHWEAIRNKWNDLQREAGLLDDYAKEHGHFNPNSTDIHETRAMKNMGHYMTKELTKSIDGKRMKALAIVNSLIKAGEIPADRKKEFVDEYTGEELKSEGKVWDCSENLSGVPYFSVPMRSEIGDLLRQYLVTGETREITGDWWTLIYFNDTSPPDLLNPEERALFYLHLDAITNKKSEKEFIPVECIHVELNILQEVTQAQMELLLN
jgi:hypothetical protein